jgi:hypothetical protein
MNKANNPCNYIAEILTDEEHKHTVHKIEHVSPQSYTQTLVPTETSLPELSAEERVEVEVDRRIDQH